MTVTNNRTDTPSSPGEKTLIDNLRGTRDAMAVQRVFGDPCTVGDVTMIPVARVGGGGGGGGGEGPSDAEGGSGFGTGFGLRVTPVGVYEVTDDGLCWKPVVDVNRAIRGGQVLAGIIAVCTTLVLLRRSR